MKISARRVLRGSDMGLREADYMADFGGGSKVKIRWLGHACFEITAPSGTTVVTDPFDEQVGYRLPAVKADVVTVSHDHFDHGNVSVIGGNPKVFRGPGRHEAHGITAEGIATFHDEAGGAKRGKNTVFVLDVGGVRLCHLGDLGHVLTDGQVKEIGPVDVLFVPVGGVYTIDAEKAKTVVAQLKPRITIPMHYLTPDLKFELDPPEKFLAGLENVEHAGNTYEVTVPVASDEARTVVMKYR